MRDVELEFDAELEGLMASLTRSNLEAEAGWEAQDAPVPRAPRCTLAGTQVSAANFACSPTDYAFLTSVLRKAFPVAALRDAVNSAAARAVMLAGNAAVSLDGPNRTAASRVAFCSCFGVVPEFVPTWRAGLPGAVRWRDLGELVAIRLRKAAKILDGGCIRYFCWGKSAYCRGCTRPAQTYYACTSLGRYAICLGGAFWRAWLAGNLVDSDFTLLHEALHIYFKKSVQDAGRTGNANCYENFAACINRLPISRGSACSPGSCAPTTLDNFRFDGHELRPHHGPLINQVAHMVVASWDTSCPVRMVQLKGFTDSVEHTPGYNPVLGLKRALSVKSGIEAAIRELDPAVAARVTLLPPLTFGAAQPVGDNATEAGSAQNRRVEVVLQPS